MEKNLSTLRKISIIVPVYNASMFLKECIESILNQSFLNFELILIDDGSTDNSLDICKKYKQNDNRVSVVQQTNSGVSSARNTGLRLASGEFVMFVDSDDLLPPDALKTLLNIMNNTVECDLVCGSYQRQFADGTSSSYCFQNDILLSQQQFRLLCYTNKMSIILGSCWGKLYRTSLIRDSGIMFPQNISYFEDNIFNILYYSKIKSARVTTAIIYTYRENKDSVSFNMKECVLKDYVVVMKYRENFFKSLDAYNFSEFATYIVSNGSYMLRILLRQELDYSNKLALIDTFLLDNLINCCIHNCNHKLCGNLKEKTYVVLMKTMSPRFIVFIFSLMDKIQNRNRLFPH